MGQTYPLPLPATTPANAQAAKPRYSVAGDWSQGATGNDIDVATRTEAVVSAADGGSITPYPTRTQVAKGAAMTPPLTPLNDLGADYGAYKGQTGRMSPIDPFDPYPDANSPPFLLSVAPNTGGVAGGTGVVLTGAGFTGATGVTFGGTAGTALVVVDGGTITVTTPAKPAGSYDVIVTTPKGASAAGVKFTYA